MNWDTYLIDDIIGNINANRIVPLIGSGAFYVEKPTVSVQEYIVRESLKCLKEIGVDVELTDSNKTEYCCGYRGMTNLNKLFVNTPRTLTKTIKRILTSPDFNSKIKLNPQIERFLSQGNFPIVLTTCVFRNIEKLIPKYKNKGIPYQMGQSEEESIPDDVVNNPCVYYLFGCIDKINEEAVLTEKEYLKYLYYIQDTNSGPTKLKEYLNPKNKEKEKEKRSMNSSSNEKYLLTLGCDVPDWTFRFLIYSLKEQNGDLIYQDRKDDTFVGGISASHIDKNFDDFLASIGYASEEDLNGLLKVINNKMEDLPQKKKPLVFLSMCHEDYTEIGEEIKQKISDTYDVWTYPDHQDFQFWEKIEIGMAECKYFVPIITDTAFIRLSRTIDIEKNLTKAKDNPKSRGIITEWQLALEYQKLCKEGQIYCIPYHLGKSFNWDEFNDELRKKDPGLDLLYPLFFPSKGAQKFDIPLPELTGAKLKNHINDNNEMTDNHESR